MTEYRDEAEPDDQRCREADRLHERAIDLCYVLNDYDKAVEALRKAVALRESILGKYNNDTALSYFRLFTILYGYKKENKEALMISRRELRISRLVLSIPLPGSGAAENHSTPVTEGVLANRISWISKVFQEENGTSKQKAKEYCSQLIKSMELERVGDVHFHERDYETAITKYDFSFTLESSSFARNFLDMADLNVKIGDCWFELEQYDKAMEEYEIAQSRYKDVFGENHSTVATVLRKSASVHLKTSNFNDALCNYAKAFAIYEKSLGKNHAISNNTLQDIRLVTVKEIEYLKRQETDRRREAEQGRYLEGKISMKGYGTAVSGEGKVRFSRE